MSRRQVSQSARALAPVVIPLVTKIVLPIAIESLRRRKFAPDGVLDDAKEALDMNLKKTKSEIEGVKDEAMARGMKIYDEARKQGAELLDSLARKGVEVAQEWMESVERPRKRRFPFGKLLALAAVVGIGIVLINHRK